MIQNKIKSYNISNVTRRLHCQLLFSVAFFHYVTIKHTIRFFISITCHILLHTTSYHFPQTRPRNIVDFLEKKPFNTSHTHTHSHKIKCAVIIPLQCTTTQSASPPSQPVNTGRLVVHSADGYISLELVLHRLPQVRLLKLSPQ